MKRRSVQHAYQNIRPDEKAKDRMLRNILLSSEISPAGKDEKKMRKSAGRIILIAAIIALMACTVATASELLKVPVKETAAFTSKDGSIEFYFDLNEEVSGEVIPIIQVRPHQITEDDARRVALALFGDGDYYEAEPRREYIYSKAEIQTKLDRWKLYTTQDAIDALYAGKGSTNRTVEIVNSFIEEFNQRLENAPTDNPHTPCQWSFRKSSEYLIPEEERDEKDFTNDNDEISAKVVVNEIPYLFSAANRDKDDFRINDIYACIEDGISPDNIDEFHFEALLCRTEEPTEEQINAAKEKASIMLSNMNLGSWRIDECYVETVSYCQVPEYVIHVNAVPVFEGIPAVRMDQIPALRGPEPGVSYYYYTDVHFEFAPGGELMFFNLDSPVDVVESSVVNDMLTVEQLLEVAKSYLSELSAEYFSWIPNAYIGNDVLMCRVDISSLDYNLTRTSAIDTHEDFIYAPGITLIGTVTYYEKESGKEIYTIADITLVAVSGVDGTVVE